jgi:ParB family transcriptional regulator, chromosome partitioning protein
MATATISAGLQTIPLDQITENPFNPRKHFEKAPLQELADSIKVHGVRQPVLVRPMGKGFQLVVGARRLRASKLAGKADIPAIVDPQLDDRSALEIMVIENLQREDVHPLDEALGYQVLMEHRCYECKAEPGFHTIDCPKQGEMTPEITVESIAAKVGKSIGYVYARMKLLAMIPAAREAFVAGSITAGHAVLIARLQPKDQLFAIRACFVTWASNFDRDLLKKLDPQKAKFYDIVNDEPTDSMLALMPEKGLREWIQDNVNLRLKDVPWDLADAKLFPEAGACATCQKRSASNPALFAELAVKGEDTCFDAACYGKKREAFVKLQIKEDKKRVDQATSFPGVDAGEKQIDRIRQISEQTAYTAPKPDQRVLKQGQWLPAKKNECPSVEEALIVNGENAGVKKLVCCNGACKVHKHHFQEAMSSNGGGYKANPAEEAKHELKQKIDEMLISAVLKATIVKLKKPDAKNLGFLADVAAFYRDEDRVAAVLGLKSEKDLPAFRKKASAADAMALMFLAIASDHDWIDAPIIKAAIKFAGVDVPKLRKELEKKELPVQTSAKAQPAAKKKGK